MMADRLILPRWCAKTKVVVVAWVLLLMAGLAPEAQAALNVTISTSTTTGGSFSGGVWTPSSSPSRINVNDLINTLSAFATVTIQTNVPGPEAGDITISAVVPFNQITDSLARTLTLNATNNILINAALDQSGASSSLNSVNLICNANSDNSGGGSTTQAAAVNTAGGNFSASGVGFTQNAGQTLQTGGGSFTLNLTGAVSLIGMSVTTSGGSFSVTAVSSSTCSSAITTSGGTLSLVLSGSGAVLTANASLNASGGAGTGTVDLRSTNGSLTLGASALCSTGGSSVTLRAGTGMTLSGDVSTSGGEVDIDITGVGNLIANSTSSISAVGGANAGDISVLVANGNITLNSGSQFRSGSAGDVTMSNNSALNDFTAAGTITGGTGGVVLSSRRHFTHTGTTAGSGTNQLGADMDFDNVGDASIGGSVSVTSSTTMRGANIEVTSTGLVDSNGANLLIQARTSATITGDVVTDGGNVQVAASSGGTGNLLINPAGLLDARGGANTGIVTLSNGGGSVTNNGEVRSGLGGRVFVFAGTSITQNGILAGGTEVSFGTTLRANNGITVSSPITAGGILNLVSDFDANSSGNLQINAAVSSNGAMTLRGVGITSNASGSLTTQNSLLSITSTGLTDLIASIQSNGGNISVTAGTTMDLGSGQIASGGGVVTLQSGSAMNLFGPVTTSGGNFIARVTGVGSLSILNDVTTSGGNVEITTANGLLSSTAGSDVNATGGAGTSMVLMESLNGLQNMTLASSVSGGSGGMTLRAGNHLTLASISVFGGSLQLAADSNAGGVGDLTLNGPISTTGSGLINMTGIGFLQSGTGTLTTAGGAIQGTFQNSVTFSRAVSSNGGQIRFTANAITVSALLSSAPPAGGSGTLHASSAVVINTTPVLGNADIILLAGTVTAPVITSPTVNAVTTNSAVLGGNVTGTGGLAILERGVVFAPTGVNPNPVIGGPSVVKLITVGALGTFTVPVSGLVLNTAYTFRAYATNFQGTAYTTPATNFSTSATFTGLADSFNAGLNGGVGSRVACMALQADGKVLIGGSFAAAFATPRGNLARFNSNSTVDSFVADTDKSVECVLVQPDGKILIGGTFTSVNGVARNGLARLNADGSVESTSTFNIGSGVDGSVFALALQPDGKILVAGTFSTVNGQARSRIARLNPNGSVESTSTFNPGSGVTGGVAVFALALQADGKIVLGGSFTTVNGSARSNLARLNSNGSLEGLGSFDPGTGPAGQVNALLVQPDGRLLVAGDFLTFNSAARGRIARLSSNGSLEGVGTFNPGTGADGAIQTMVLQADGKILLGGQFVNVNGQPRARVARLQANGALESLSTFNIGSGPNGSLVESLALQADGKILLGGDFSQVNGASRALQARLNNDGTSLTLSAPDAGTVRFLRGGAAPEIEPPRFELSTDSGATWTLIGFGSRITGGWELTGQALPANGLLRASGGIRSGSRAGSASRMVNTQGFGLPRIGVTGQGEPVAQGDTSTSTVNGTDFGPVLTAGVFATEQTFAIESTGGQTLTLTGSPRVVLSGPNAADFRMEQQPTTASLPTGSAETFVLRFNPSAPGRREATVSIASNDSTANPFTFAVSGVGTLGGLLAQSLVLNTPAAVLVNEGPVPLQVHATSGLPVTLSVLSGPATLAGTNLIPNGVGTVKLEATQAGDALYRPAKTVIRSIVVRPAPTTPTLAQVRPVYDGTAHAIEVRGNLNAPVVTYRVDGVDTAQPPAQAGSYAVSVAVDGKVVKGKLDILPALLMARPDSQRRFVGVANPAFSIAYEGFQGSDNASTVFAVPGAGARAPQVSTRAQPGSPGGVYPLIASRGVLRNYRFVYLPGYLTIETFAGKYEALLTDIGSVEALGKVEITVASSDRSFSGRVTWGQEAAAFPISGALSPLPQDTLGGGSGLVVRGSNSYRVDFQVPFDRDCFFNLERNQVPNAIAFASNGRKVYVPPRGQKAAFEGRHTLILEPGTPQGTGVPAGNGQATAVVDRLGKLRLTGKLADGRALTATLAPDERAGYRLFVQPYRRANSHLSGALDLLPHPTLAGRRYAPLGSNRLVWRKAGSAIDSSYRNGLGPLEMDFRLDPWLPPTPTTTLGSLLALSGGNVLVVQHSGFTSAVFADLPITLELLPNRKVIVTAPVTSPPNRTGWKTTFNAATGTFAGSFQLLDSVPAPTTANPAATRNVTRRISFTGVLRQPHGTTGDSLVGSAPLLIPALPTAATNEAESAALTLRP